jgi:hypothetical protein
MVIFNIAVLTLVIEARPIPNLPGRKSLKFQGGPQEVENVEVEKVERVKIVEVLAEATKRRSAFIRVPRSRHASI